MKIRTLYDCYHARYPTTGDHVVCDQEHDFGKRVNKLQVDRNDKLVFRICQLCVDYSEMNDPLVLSKAEGLVVSLPNLLDKLE